MSSPRTMMLCQGRGVPSWHILRSRAAYRGPTMFADQMSAAINQARTLTRLDDLSKAIWQGFSAHAVTDDQAQSLAELIHARRPLARGEGEPARLARPGREG